MSDEIGGRSGKQQSINVSARAKIVRIKQEWSKSGSRKACLEKSPGVKLLFSGIFGIFGSSLGLETTKMSN